MKLSTYIKRYGQEAIWLISRALHMHSSWVLARYDFTDWEAAEIEKLIVRRERGEPLQYILGSQEFYGREFEVGEGALIPRHDTETLITAAKRLFAPDDKFSFLDWGTGTGCIAITLLLEFPNSHAFMLDISNEALEYAKSNLWRYDVRNRAEIISEFTGMNDISLIISNPPYIPSGEIDTLMREVKDYEPRTALDGGIDGMKYYREILAVNYEGYIVLEVGNMKQYEFLRKVKGFRGEIYDEGGFPRCVVIRRKR